MIGVIFVVSVLRNTSNFKLTIFSFVHILLHLVVCATWEVGIECRGRGCRVFRECTLTSVATVTVVAKNAWNVVVAFGFLGHSCNLVLRYSAKLGMKAPRSTGLSHIVKENNEVAVL